MTARRSARLVHRLLVVAVCLALTAWTAGTATAAAEPDGATGDITAPELLGLSLEPPSVDVTESSATANVQFRLVDRGTGVRYASLGWRSPVHAGGMTSIGAGLVSGDASDGVYRAAMDIPQGAAEGSWPIEVQAFDRVGNQLWATQADLAAAGFPSSVDVVDRAPDVDPPTLVDVQITPVEVDVRSRPDTVTVRMHLRDEASGVVSAAVFPHGPRPGRGGVEPAGVRYVAGTPQDGWWEAELYVPPHAHAGSWLIGLRLQDRLGNVVEVKDLQSRGLPGSFTVTSVEDVQPPVVTRASLSRIEIDVSQADQEIVFEAEVTDDLAGVKDLDWGVSDVQVSLQHPLSQTVNGYARRISGSTLDGSYRATLRLPRASATGIWTVRAAAEDPMRNRSSFLSPAEAAAASLPPVIVVYNTPLPPLDVEVAPADGAAIVEWAPPADDRGAEVNEYVVRDLTGGKVVSTDGDARRAVMTGLDNEVEHRFVVHAVNRAGESDPSAEARAVPSASLPVPAAAVTRLQGADRVATAIAVSRDGFPAGGADAVVLSRSDDYADALAGTPLAVSVGGPLLITPTASLAPAARTEIVRVLKPGGTVHVLGGPAALSPAVVDALVADGYRVVRHAGGNRYETAVRVADATSADPTVLLLATGRSFADALGAGAAAASVGGVVVLTDDARLPEATATYLARQRGSRFAIGGPAAAADPSAEPLVGQDRYATSVLTARRFPGNGAVVGLARGDGYPDALASGSHAARAGGPLMLTRPDALPDVVADHLTANRIRTAYVYGGSAAVQDVVVRRVEQLLGA